MDKTVREAEALQSQGKLEHLSSDLHGSAGRERESEARNFERRK